jgi:hypothetical protein
MASTFEAQYVAYRIGKTADRNGLCSLDENIFSSITAMVFPRRHPIIHRFNIVIRRCIEAGLGDKYWSDLQFNLTLQNMKKLGESDCQACNDEYFVFSLTHMRVAFIVLGFGYVLSVAVFVAELILKWLPKLRIVTVNKHEIPPITFFTRPHFCNIPSQTAGLRLPQARGITQQNFTSHKVEGNS